MSPEKRLNALDKTQLKSKKDIPVSKWGLPGNNQIVEIMIILQECGFEGVPSPFCSL